MALWHDLTQRPLLQAVLVPVVLDREVLEAFHPVDGAAQVIEHRVDHLGRCALEAMFFFILTNVNVCRGQQSFVRYIVLKCFRLIMIDACVDLHVVELYEAFNEVLGALRDDFGLEGHALEGKVIDCEGKFIRRDIVAQRNLPL